MLDGSTASELERGIEAGATGNGILRTEWIGWDDHRHPSRERHYDIYAECIRRISPHRLNVRLFDIGGDKIPTWANGIAKHMQSPLGHRGIRSVHLVPHAFDAQLESIVATAQYTPLGVVVPMVTDIGDVLLVKQKLLNISGQTKLKNLYIGAMVEVPSAALNIADILSEVDFIRIGPGDLTQFTLAKLRTDLAPQELSGNFMHPAVLKLIGHVVTACKKVNKAVSI